MKKILSLIIVFLSVFNLLSCAFAIETKTVDFNSFDEYSIAQVQNTFSSSLTQEKNSDTRSEKSMDDKFLYNQTDYNIPNCSFMNLKEKEMSFIFSDINNLSGENYLHKYQLFYKNNLVDGISEYKITQNTYMAVVLFDIVKFVYI
jgi:hypothetical protein